MESTLVYTRSTARNTTRITGNLTFITYPFHVSHMETINRGFGLDRVTGYFEDWTMFEKSWLVIFSLLNLYLWFSWNQSVTALVASMTGLWTVVLVAKGKVENYYFGIVNVALYGLLAYQAQFFGEVMLNWAFFLPAQFVGLYIWKNNLNVGNYVKTESLTLRNKVLLGLGALLAIGLYALVLMELKGNLPTLDSTSTVLSVLAQLLMIKRMTEQWAMWITVDVVSIYMWATTFLATGSGLLMVVMWSAYLVNAVYGWYNWRKMNKTQEAV